MTSSKAHIIAGTILALIAGVFLFKYNQLSLLSIPILVLIVYFYSQLPDIDHENSKITWNILSIGALITLYGLGYTYFPEIFVFNTLIFGISVIVLIIIAAKMEHRGPTHTIWFIALASLLLLLIPDLPNKWTMVIIAFISSYSHLVLDGYFFKNSWQPKKGVW